MLYLGYSWVGEGQCFVSAIVLWVGREDALMLWRKGGRGAMFFLFLFFGFYLFVFCR